MPNDQDKAVESAVAAMAAGAPSDWVSLRAVFTPVKASATVDTESADEAVRLDISPEALQDIASHQRRAAEIGEPWHRLVIDFDRSGRLSVRAVPEDDPRLRRVTWVLLLVALLVLAAGAVYVLVTLA
ncbi:hypothetical protein [Mycolicibacterium stellerae]|uniref:hypothetical protein n=1 Tax=Mycolicibacterium stellerae TaxID=2358193 RepID=UPI000F0B710E|nr:hypothetical protein [Mycolicibacterium stellerae]